MKSHRLTPLATSILLGFGYISSACASGFAIIEQSVNGIGNAFAGAAAVAEDASTIYFNPAGMSRLDAQVEFGVNVISPTIKFDDQGSVHATTAPLDVNNEDGGDAGSTGVVPNFYYVRPLDNQWTFGFGLNAPFGLTTDYNRGWVGRYHALTSELKTINLNPSLAYKASDKLSLGFGINAQYIDARLTSAVDFGTIFAATMAVSPQGADGEADIQGDDWSFGYNFGVLWQATDQTRIGAAYRSRIKHKLEGDAEFNSSALVQTLIAGFGAGRFVNSDVEADVELPDSLSVSFYHDINDKWSVMGDVTWTNWSLLDELRIEFDNPVQPDNVTTLKWNDTNRYSIGATYRHTDKWTWRAGLAFDESPTPNATYRTPRVPDEDRTWVAAGFTYKHSDRLVFDVGYAHLFVEDAKINKPLTDPENLLRGNLVGEYESDVNIFSAKVRWLF